jgi:WXXGXW repeat (2 copies)
MKLRLARPALALAMLCPVAAWSQASLSITIGPPPLLVYAQPQVPGEGYIWTPGYWSWSPADSDYYWVPGTWVLAPSPGMLWTPGYWAFEGESYRWRGGYWADHVGFYGGLNYGYGYTGSGYWGGRWQGGVFAYNRSVNNVNTTIVHNVYNTTVVNNYNVTRVSFNGGPKGTTARPTPAELQVQASRHIEPTPNQLQHEHTALATPTQRASVNHGAPQVAATPKPAAFTAPEVVHARSEPGAARTAGDAKVQQPAPIAAQRVVPQPPRTEAHTSPQPAAARDNAAPRGAPPVAHVAHNMQPLPVHEAPAAEKPAAAHTEAAPRSEPMPVPHAQPPQSRAEPQPRAEPAPHAQPPQSRAEPQPRAERPEASPRAEPRGQEKPNEKPNGE